MKGCYQVTSELSLLQAEQPQLSQPDLVGEVFDPLVHFFCGHPLDVLQQVHVSSALRTLHLDGVLQVRPLQYRAEGQDHLPAPADHASFDADQDMVGFLGWESTLLAHVQLAIHQYLQVFWDRPMLSLFIPQHVLVVGGSLVPRAGHCTWIF